MMVNLCLRGKDGLSSQNVDDNLFLEIPRILRKYNS